MFELIADMNKALPLYERTLSLYQGEFGNSLRSALQDLFNEYVDCCLAVMKEFTQSALSEYFQVWIAGINRPIGS